jgi:2-polyprenyl-6-hydroxyphenyl methylase/3-demethylubiquinone-9 3-methyltransferase
MLNCETILTQKQTLVIGTSPSGRQPRCRFFNSHFGDFIGFHGHATAMNFGLYMDSPIGMYSAASHPTMKRLYIQENWPTSWKYSYAYDLEEVYGEAINLGYAYAYNHRRSQIIRLLTERLAPNARILDIAAAQGNFSITLAEMGYNVTWNDIREDLADYVRLKLEKGKIDFAPGNAFELDFHSQFDAILIAEIIEHVAHPDEFLRKTAQLVKPGGYIVMTTPNGAYFRNPLPKFSNCQDPSIYEAIQFKPNGDGHIFLLHPDEIEQLALQAGLEVEEISLFNNPLTNGFMKMEHLLRVLPQNLVNSIETATQRLPDPVRRNFMVHMAVRFRKPEKS